MTVLHYKCTFMLCSYLFSQGRVVTTNRMGNGIQ